MDWAHIGQQLGLAALFTFFGLALFAMSYIIIEKMAPFDLRKELTEDDNPAVGVMLAGVFVGIGIIIGASLL